MYCAGYPRANELAAYAQRRLCELSGQPPLHPIDDTSWFSQMCVAPLPDTDLGKLSARLYDHYRIETAMSGWGGGKRIRISVQAYIDQNDVDGLVDAIRESV